MYLNLKLFKQYNLKPQDLYYLLIIKQVDLEEMKQIPDDVFGRFDDLNLLKEVKRKNRSQSVLELVRLSKRGIELIDNLSTPNVLEEHLRMRDYLISLYLNHEDTERVVGNKKLIANYIAVLQNHLSIDIYRFYYLCEFFLSEHFFTKKLENVFMDRNKIRYGEFKNHIEDSPLFQFYEQRKKDIEHYWQQKIK